MITIDQQTVSFQKVGRDEEQSQMAEELNILIYGKEITITDSPIMIEIPKEWRK